MRRCCGHVPTDARAVDPSGYFVPWSFFQLHLHARKYHTHPPVKPNRRRVHRRRS